MAVASFAIMPSSSGASQEAAGIGAVGGKDHAPVVEQKQRRVIDRARVLSLALGW
jgi:hypothetical protein